MKMFLEDYFPKEILEILRKIDLAEDWSFNNLVRLSEMIPSEDFRFLDLKGMDLRGEDLRGFDFTGCDMRGCIRDSRTQIDRTTVLSEAILDWVDVEEPTIVQKMWEVESAKGSKARRNRLAQLETQYRSPDHIRIYLRNLISSTKSVEAFFDYLDFFKPITLDDIAAVARGLRRFSVSSVKTPGRSGRYISPSTTSFQTLLNRIGESSNPIARDAFNRYLGKLEYKGRENRNPSKSFAEEDFQSLLVSIDEAGGQGSLFSDYFKEYTFAKGPDAP